MVAVIIIESLRRRAVEDHPVAFFLEETGRHRRSRTNLLRVKQPAISPLRFQAFARQEEVRRRSSLIMRRIPRDVTLQTGRTLRGEQRTRQVALLVRQWVKLLADVRVL